jgi:protease I
MGRLDGKRIAILATDGVERVELTEPRDAVTAEGATTRSCPCRPGDQGHGPRLEPSGTFTVDRVVADVTAGDYDALLMPGGTVNGDKLRVDDDVRAFVRSVFDAGKPVAAICHAPWTLIDAGVVTGLDLTAYPSVWTDLRNAGANAVDEQVVHDGNLVTSRNPDDLPAFCPAVVELFAR